MKKLFLLFTLFIGTINAQYNLDFYNYLNYSKTNIVKELETPDNIKYLNDVEEYCYIYIKNINSDLIENSILSFCFDEKNDRVNIVALGYKLKRENSDALEKFVKLMVEKLKNKKFKLIDKKLNIEEESYSLILYHLIKGIRIEIKVKNINNEYLSIILIGYKIN